MLWPIIPFNYSSINYDTVQLPAPAPPSSQNWLGTDDQGRDVLARVIYGFRISVLFALTLTLVSSMIGVFVGALQGFYGSWVDLVGQRFLEYLVGTASLVSIDYYGQLYSAQFLVVTGNHAAIFSG